MHFHKKFNEGDYHFEECTKKGKSELFEKRFYAHLDQNKLFNR